MVAASNRDAARKPTGETAKRETISRSMYEKVLKENEFLKKQVAELKRENRDLQREIGSLRRGAGRRAA